MAHTSTVGYGGIVHPVGEDSMGFAKKLQARFDGLSKLSGGTLQKRRDTLNRAGVHHEKSKATFSTNVKGTEKRFSGSQVPRGL